MCKSAVFLVIFQLKLKCLALKLNSPLPSRFSKKEKIHTVSKLYKKSFPNVFESERERKGPLPASKSSWENNKEKSGEDPN